MQTARIYKIKLHENVLRQVVFTDRNCFLGLCALVAIIFWQLGEYWSNDVKIFLSISFAGSALLFLSFKIDRQSLVKLFPRLLNYLTTLKEYRQ